MDFFRWKRTFLRALLPAVLCASLAGWGVYVLTADERPTYRSQALLNTGIMTGRDGSGSYVRDLVLNELENIMNLARSFETREELSVILFAKLLSVDRNNAEIISPRAYDDFFAELDSTLVERYVGLGSEEEIHDAIIADRDSLKRLGELTAEAPLIELLYGDDPLVGAESLADLRVVRKGMSDLLELSYSTVDAAWCKLTLDEHIRVFLAQHKLIEEQRSGGALAYFQEATLDARKKLNDIENRLRDFSTDNKIINYYEQTRFIASLKNQVDSRFTEEKMVQAAADSTLTVLQEKLAKRMDLVRLNNIVDDRRRELGQLSREQARLQIMSADSSDTAESDLERIQLRMRGIRKGLSQDIGELQGVYNGPEGLELGNLISQWLAATVQAEESKGRIDVLAERKTEFGGLYTKMASLGSSMKKLEREVHIAEEDYLENLRNLNEARQKEHSQRSITDLRLVDSPVLPTKPEKSTRLIMVFAALLVGGIFPIILAIALELLSGAILSFEEGERRAEILVVGGVARWSTVRKILRRKSEAALRATTADLLWQGLRSRGNASTITTKPHLITFSSLRPGAGKSYVINLLAKRLAQRGMQVCVVTDKSSAPSSYPGVQTTSIDPIEAMSPGVDACKLTRSTPEQWAALDVVLWELPAIVTGRIPVDVARASHDALLVHPASAGWTSAHSGGLTQLKDTFGKAPQLILNGISADVLLNEWGSTWSQINSWAKEEEAQKDMQSQNFTLLNNSLKSEAAPVGKASLFEEQVPIVNEPTLETKPTSEVQSIEEAEQLQIPVKEEIVSSVEPSTLDLELGKKVFFDLPEQPTTPAQFPHAEVAADSEQVQDAPDQVASPITPVEPASTWEEGLMSELDPDLGSKEPMNDDVASDQSDWEQNLLN